MSERDQALSRQKAHAAAGCVLAWLAACAAVAPLAAQRPAPADTAADTMTTPAAADRGQGAAPERTGPSPAGSFVRSLLVPGWGQAAVGAHFRGGVYFATQTGSWYMLLKTTARLAEARDVAAQRVEARRADLFARAATDTTLARRLGDPDTLAAEIAADSSVALARRLIDSREEQREDWIAWTVFWTLVSAADAYVSAHLADFPAELAVEPRGGGGLDLGVRVPLRRRR